MKRSRKPRAEETSRAQLVKPSLPQKSVCLRHAAPGQREGEEEGRGL